MPSSVGWLGQGPKSKQPKCDMALPSAKIGTQIRWACEGALPNSTRCLLVMAVPDAALRFCVRKTYQPCLATKKIRLEGTACKPWEIIFWLLKGFKRRTFSLEFRTTEGTLSLSQDCSQCCRAAAGPSRGRILAAAFEEISRASFQC